MARNLEVHTGVLHYWSFGLEAADDAHNVWVDTAHGKDNDQQNPSKMTSFRARTQERLHRGAFKFCKHDDLAIPLTGLVLVVQEVRGRRSYCWKGPSVSRQNIISDVVLTNEPITV